MVRSSLIVCTIFCMLLFPKVKVTHSPIYMCIVRGSLRDLLTTPETTSHMYKKSAYQFHMVQYMIVILEFGIMVLLAAAPCRTQRRHRLDIQAESNDAFPPTKGTQNQGWRPGRRRQQIKQSILCRTKQCRVQRYPD